MKIPKNPEIQVLDLAIKLIQNGTEKYSSRALSMAECTLVTAEYDHNSHYRYQYRQYVLSIYKGKLPRWWNSDRPHKRARIKALQSFKQACIDAAKKG